MKITERDKILLVVLAIILVVALAIVLPGIGIMACNENVSTYKNKEGAADSEIKKLQKELTDNGVQLSVAENAKQAAKKLDDDTWTLKEEASRLARNIEEWCRTDQVQNWAISSAYRYGIVAEDSDILLKEELTGTGSTLKVGDVGDKKYSLDGVEYTMQART